MRVKEAIKGVGGVLLLLFPLVGTAQTSCQETRLILGSVSNHFDKDKDYNESNESFGVWCDDWSLVRYNNSYNKDSTLVSKEFSFYHTKYSYSALEFGVATGYGVEEQRNIDGVILFSSLKTNFFLTERTHIVWRLTYGITALSLEYKL